jgi:membrane-bound lytic murein transglycosylase D
MSIRKQLFSILCILFLGGNVVQAGTPESGRTPKMLLTMSAYHISAPLDFCGEAVPLDNQDVRERMERELLISAWNYPQVILWMKRSGRYMPYIEKMLRENKMPDDLKFVTIAESALRNYAGSSKGAKGVWQFMEGTGTKYHLKVDDDFDERRSFFAATRAALNYLKDLYAMFGSWTLAVAAYNMGESGLQSEMLIQKVNNYYQIYLPLETQQYVFRILSAKLILSNPSRYGFHLSEQDLYSPHSVEQVEIRCPQDTPVQIIAQAAKTYFKVIRDLNPEIRGYYLPAGHHVLFVPRDAADGFQTRFEGLTSQWLADRKANVYIVKKGDNFFSLAERFKVPIQAILAWNRITMKKKLNPGDRLIIFPKALKAPESKDK